MDMNSVKAKATEVAAELKNLDMGILVTKATTLASKIDLDGVKKKMNDIMDSPETDKVKGMVRLASGFAAGLPGFVQGVVGSFQK